VGSIDVLLSADCDVGVGVHGQHGQHVMWIDAERLGQWAVREWGRPRLPANHHSTCEYRFSYLLTSLYWD